MRAAAARVGLPTGKGGASPHWLRHAHATHALEHGHAPIHLVQATLGHASVATTGTYLHAQRTAAPRCAGGARYSWRARRWSSPGRCRTRRRPNRGAAGAADSS